MPPPRSALVRAPCRSGTRRPGRRTSRAQARLVTGFGQHLAQCGSDEVDLLLATDQRGRQLHHWVTAVVGPADQSRLEQGAGEEPPQQLLGFVVVERETRLLVLHELN